MKYIRTKAGAILDTTKTDFFKPIKRADTIEELCDEFVSKNKLLKPKYIYTNETLIQSWRNRFEEEIIVKCNKDIKGAIWTEKGLIYVAKIKGVLPNGEIDWELL